MCVCVCERAFEHHVDKGVRVRLIDLLLWVGECTGFELLDHFTGTLTVFCTAKQLLQKQPAQHCARHACQNAAVL